MPLTEWQPRETIPEEYKDGRRFLARTADFEHGGEFNVRVQEARWSGRTPDDRAGHFASANGQMVTHWMPMPPQPTTPAEQSTKDDKR